jgi:hypothetical protein
VFLDVLVLTLLAIQVTSDAVPSGSGRQGNSSEIIFAHVMPGKQAILTVTEDKIVRLISSNGVPLLKFTVGRIASPGGIDLSPDGRTLAIGHESGVDLWDTTSGRRCKTQVKATSATSKLLFSPNGRFLLVDHEVRGFSSVPVVHFLSLYDLENGQLFQFCGVSSYIEYWTFSSDGTKVRTISSGAKQEFVIKPGSLK